MFTRCQTCSNPLIFRKLFSGSICGDSGKLQTAFMPPSDGAVRNREFSGDRLPCAQWFVRRYVHLHKNRSPCEIAPVKASLYSILLL